MTPLRAREPQNEDAARHAIDRHARSSRKPEPISPADSLKVIREPGMYMDFKLGFHYGSARAYKVRGLHSELGQVLYSLEGYPTPLLRHELLNAQAVFRVREKQGFLG